MSNPDTPQPTTVQMHVNPIFIEELSKLEHQQWTEWAGSLMEKENLSEERCERWRQFMVPYDQLPEDVKEFDRVWARRAAAIILKYLLLGKFTEARVGDDDGPRADDAPAEPGPAGG